MDADSAVGFVKFRAGYKSCWSFKCAEKISSARRAPSPRCYFRRVVATSDSHALTPTILRATRVHRRRARQLPPSERALTAHDPPLEAWTTCASHGRADGAGPEAGAPV